MNHYMKKIVAILVSMMLISSFCISLANAQVTVAADTALIKYVQSILPQVLDFHKITAKGNTIILGNAIPTYCFIEGEFTMAEYEIFPLFINGEIRSLIRKQTASNGSVSYSCRFDAQNIYNIDADEGAFVYIDEVLYLVNMYSDRMNLIDIARTSSTKFDVADIYCATISPRNGITITSSELSSFSKPATRMATVPYIENDTISCCPPGLCWAACAASLANKFAGGSYNSALDFHNSVDCYLFQYVDYHVYMIVFLNDAGVITPSVEDYNGITYEYLKGIVDDGAAVLLDMRYQSSSQSLGHYVIAYEYFKSSFGTKHLYYMDPNEGYCTAQFQPSGRLILPFYGKDYVEHCNLECQ